MPLPSQAIRRLTILLTLVCGIPLGSDSAGFAAADLPDQPLAQGLEQSLVLATESGAPPDLRIERFTATLLPGVYWKFDISYFDELTTYRVLLESGRPGRLFEPTDTRGSISKYWSQIPPAPGIGGLDGLVDDARQKVAAAGLEPASLVHIKYRMASPRPPAATPHEIMEVFVEVAGESKARRAVYHDRIFQGLSPARLIKVKIPGAGVPQPAMPAPKIPQPSIPAPKLPQADFPEIRLPEINDTRIRVQENERLAMLTLSSDILFDFDQWHIRLDAEAALQQAAGVLAGRYAAFPVEVHGHTDSRGAEAYNFDLSRRRGGSVKQWLVGQGIAPERIGVHPQGELQPLAPNRNRDGSDNPAGRQLNRRVEIRVLK